jgi:4-hydroxy-tetrahydrodipicolinate synthase
VKFARKRVPVIAGTGGNATREAIELGRFAARAGADYTLSVVPYYNKPTQEGLYRHFKAIAESSDIPVILYNVPSRTSCNVLPATVEEIASDPRVIGVKEASGDIVQVAELARRVGDRLSLYSGNDDQVVPLLALGGKGVISVLGNIAPAAVSRMVHRFLAGDIEEARRLQLGFLPLIQALFREPNPIPVKAAVETLGFAVGPTRLPLVPITDPARRELLARMNDLGISELAGAHA